MERAVTTYLGGDALLTAFGFGTQENFRAMEAGRCALRPVSEPCELAAAGKIDPETLRSFALEGYTLLESAMIRAVDHALTESGLSLGAEECRLVVSTTKGNVDLLRGSAVPPEAAYLSTLADRIAGRFGAVHRPLVVSNACISGVTALIVARRMIRDGVCRHVVVVGGDLLTEFVAAGFLSFKSVRSGPCRPYDLTPEHGLSLGEAVGALVLTADPARAKGPAVVLEGGAVTNDANHISGPSRTGDGLHYAIERALEEACVGREEISFLNAHGTGTAYNDAMESRAVTLSGLNACPMNSLKGYIGHTLGASGIVESILAAEQLRRGVLLGTAGFTAPGVPCPVNVSSQHRRLAMRHGLKTASGFGGCNAAIVLGLEAFVPKERASFPDRECRLTATYALPHGEAPFEGMIRAAYKRLGAPNLKFYKMDDLSKTGYVAAEYLLRDRRLSERYAPTEIAVVLENRSSSLDSDLAHQRIVDAHPEEGASPAVFVYTLPNVVAGEICIRHRIQGENTFFVTDGDGTTARQYARRLVERGVARAAIYGRCEYFAGRYDVELNLLEAL